MKSLNSEKFIDFDLVEPSNHLFDKVIGQIQQFQKEKKVKTVRRRIFVFSALSLIFIVAFVPAFSAMKTNMVESGFLDFASLLFSDFNIVISYWQNFAMSLLESLPVMNLAIVFFVALAFLWSLKSLFKDVELFANHQRLSLNRI